MAKGTNMTDQELKNLQDAGFKFTSSVNEQESNDPPSGKRSKKWRHGISRDATKELKKDCI